MIVPLSSVIFDAILCGKPVISYERWREHLYYKSETVYEDMPMVFRAVDRKGLHDCCRRAMRGERPEEDDLEELYRERISAGLGTGESIISRYVDLIEKHAK